MSMDSIFVSPPYWLNPSWLPACSRIFLANSSSVHGLGAFSGSAGLGVASSLSASSRFDLRRYCSNIFNCCSAITRGCVVSERTVQMPFVPIVSEVRCSAARVRPTKPASQAAKSAMVIRAPHEEWRRKAGHAAERRTPARRGSSGGSHRAGALALFGLPAVGQQKLFLCCLPEGDLKIAHPFKGGIDESKHRVP